MVTPTRILLDWYLDHRRDLPWRHTTDPYHIWVAEIMLQQTQVKTVIPFYTRWMQQFPDLETLASASEEEVLANWAGLGYYRRARFLHEGATEVLRDHRGRFPAAVDEVQKIRGIGEYTSAAILSQAFGLPHPVIDGNVMRVVSRVMAWEQDPRKSAAKKRILAITQEWMPARDLEHQSDNPCGDFNQAMMELGATVCTPRNPSCDSCPLESICVGKVDPGRYPTLQRKKTFHVRTEVALITSSLNGRDMIVASPRDGTEVMAHRSGELKGLWRFPQVSSIPRLGSAAKLERDLSTQIELDLGSGADHVRDLNPFSHGIMDQRIRCTGRLFRRTETSLPAPWRWVALQDLATLPLASAERRLLDLLLEDQ